MSHIFSRCAFNECRYEDYGRSVLTAISFITGWQCTERISIQSASHEKPFKLAHCAFWCDCYDVSHIPTNVEHLVWVISHESSHIFSFVFVDEGHQSLDVIYGHDHVMYSPPVSLVFSKVQQMIAGNIVLISVELPLSARFACSESATDTTAPVDGRAPA